jgi:hypothetical protein
VLNPLVILFAQVSCAPALARQGRYPTTWPNCSTTFLRADYTTGPLMLVGRRPVGQRSLSEICNVSGIAWRQKV